MSLCEVTLNPEAILLVAISRLLKAPVSIVSFILDSMPRSSQVLSYLVYNLGLLDLRFQESFNPVLDNLSPLLHSTSKGG